MSVRSTVAAFLSIVSAVPLFGDGISSLTIRSSVIGEDRVIHVRVPPGYSQNNVRYPVLYITDSEANLLHTASSVEVMARNGRVPEMIIVGITNTNRTRDLTPTKIADRPEGGGADRFLTFVEKELMPRIDREYRTEPVRFFAGHSLGGLLALHAAFTRPKLFQGVIASTPSLGWDDRIIEKEATAFIDKHPDRRMNVYFTVANEGRATKENFDRFRALLESKAPKTLEWSSAHFEDEDHGSVVLVSNYHGLRWLFRGWLPPVDTLADLAAMDEHYRQLSGRYGYTVRAPEGYINLLGYRQLLEGKPEEAIRTFRANVARFPNSPNVYDSLGEVLEKIGDPVEARKLYEKAWELGEKLRDPNAAIFRANFKRVDEALKKKK